MIGYGKPFIYNVGKTMCSNVQQMYHNVEKCPTMCNNIQQHAFIQIRI